MNIKLQLKVMSFLQFFLWGSWLNTFGSYLFITLGFKGEDIGAVYSTLGIAALITSPLLGSLRINGSVLNGFMPLVIFLAR